MKHNKYSKEQLTEAIANSTSIRQALLFLNISAKGGNYHVIHKAIQLYNIDISHFKPQLGWSKGLKLKPKRSIIEYLTNDYPISSYRLKNRLLAEGLFDPTCSCCKESMWLGQNIPLELDHIDGDSSNNYLNNLRLLCPNCHALTDTYRGKNQKRAKNIKE